MQGTDRFYLTSDRLIALFEVKNGLPVPLFPAQNVSKSLKDENEERLVARGDRIWICKPNTVIELRHYENGKIERLSRWFYEWADVIPIEES